jgi:hypothetical protein
MRSKHFLSLCLAVGSFAAAGLVAGCGSESTGSGGSGGGSGGEAPTTTTTTSGTPTTTSGTPTTSTTTTTTGGTTTSTGTGGAEGDGNDDFADAVEIDPAGIQDTLQDPSKDVDYFKFDGKAGEVWLISSSSHFQTGTDEDPGYIDTYLELYDASNKLIATNDDSYPRFNTDSELITVLPATGTYSVKIQEWCTSPTMSPTACDQAYFDALINLDYSVFATAIPPGPGMILETEPNDTGAAATPLSYSQTSTVGSYYLTLLSGKLPMSSDSDWYSFTVPANLKITAGSRAKTSFLVPWGSTAGNGSDVKVGKVEVVDATTMAVVSSFDMSGELPATDRADLSLPVTPGGNYFLKVNHGGAEADGQGQFYLVYETLGSGNPLETKDVENSLPLTAEVLPESSPGSFFIEGNLAVGDVDYFKFPSNGEDTVSIACASQRNGSGLRGFKATVYKADGTTAIAKGTATETGAKDLFIDHTAITAADTDLVVKLEATLPADVTNTGSYYICGFHVGPAVQ